jgi:GT2 family glycosyltransferase
MREWGHRWLSPDRLEIPKMLYVLRFLELAFLTVLLTPFLVVLGATLLFFNAVHLATRFTRKPLSFEDAPLSGLASIIVLNWNGKDLLAQGLPSVLEAVRADGRPHEIIVVDNGSNDGSCEFVREEFPSVRLVRLEENLGFAAGNNEGVRAALHDIVILLNNDMVVDPGFLRPLLEGFEPDTFAVSSQIFLQDPSARREETGKTTAAFRRGCVDFGHDPVDGARLQRRYYPAFWAGGGSSAFHRGRYLALGGLSEIYSPAYVEDTDLSYRAWAAGWDVLFTPDSVVHHRHRASSRKRFSPMQLQCLIQRNQFLFFWRNIRGWRLLLAHCAFLPWTCYRLARDHGTGIWRSLFQAAAKFPELQIDRLGPSVRRVRSDRQIFEVFRNPGRHFARRSRRGGTSNSRIHDDDPRPRVLWVTAYLPHLGRHAGAARMHQLLQRISREYRVTLLTFLEYDSETEFLPGVEPYCEQLVAMRRRPPLRWPLFPYEPFDEFRTPEMDAAVRSALTEKDFALIQLEYSQMGCYADKTLGIPAILTKHEVDFAACARRARLERGVFRRVRWFYNYLQVLDREVRLARKADAIVCMTEPDAASFRRFCSDVPVHVINTGVDLDFFRPPDPAASRPRLVFVGAFQHHPNVDAMLYFCGAILPRIRLQVPDVEFVIVGSGPPPSIAALAETPGIEVTGFVEDIRPHMASSSVYVVPLRLGVGIRGKILEAWAMGMPVVATPVACAGLRYEHGRNILVAESDEGFAEQVVTLLRDPELRSRMGTDGRRVVEEQYGWDASASQLLRLYRQYDRLTGRPEPARSRELMNTPAIK